MPYRSQSSTDLHQTRHQCRGSGVGLPPVPILAGRPDFRPGCLVSRHDHSRDACVPICCIKIKVLTKFTSYCALCLRVFANFHQLYCGGLLLVVLRVTMTINLQCLCQLSFVVHILSNSQIMFMARYLSSV